MGRIQNWVLAVAGLATAGLFGISVTDIKGCAKQNQYAAAAISPEVKLDIERKLRIGDMLTGRSISSDRWDATVMNYAVTLQKARIEGLAVSDHELGQFIMSQFQTKDQYRQYTQAMKARYNIEVHEIEGYYRDQILMQKSMNLPLLAAYVTNNEIKDEFHRREDGLVYDKLSVSVDSMTLASEPSAEEKQSYFEEVSLEATYQIPPKVRVEYLFVNPEDMVIADLSEAKKRDYYNQNRDRYASTEFPGEAKPYFEVEEEVAIAFQKDQKDSQAKALLSQLDNELLKDTELNFSATLSAALAKNPEFKKVKLGTTEPFAEKDYRVEPLGYVHQLTSRLFGEHPRTYGGVLEAGNGFYIYKVIENIPGRQETFEEAEAKVVEALTLKKKEELAKKMAEEWKPKLEAAQDWSKLELPEGVSYLREDVTGIFGIEANTALNSGNVVSEPIESNGTYALVKLVERKASDAKLLAEQKEQIKEGLLRQKAQNIQFARYTQAQLNQPLE
jgi:hypothetical protein